MKLSTIAAKQDPAGTVRTSKVQWDRIILEGIKPQQPRQIGVANLL